jgi:hypothetical protein
MGRIAFEGQSWQKVVRPISAKQAKSATWVAVGRGIVSSTNPSENEKWGTLSKK